MKLLSEIQSDRESKSIIFGETKKKVDDIKYFLMKNNFRAVAIHGDKSQRERDFVLNKFRQDRQSILIATDVASRGLGEYSGSSGVCLGAHSAASCTEAESKS